MAKDVRYTIRFDTVTANKIIRRAQDRGLSATEYLRACVESDLESGGQADILAPVGLKYSVVSCLLIRQVVDQVLGVERGADLERSANAKADAFCASLSRR